MDKISIIVPVYNVEQYIDKCLNSLTRQDYPNFDIWVINDGSPANEQVIIDKYVKDYPNIVKTVVKENGGYGSALEVGFRSSDAKYVLVCDPDDYLVDDALSVLHGEIEKTGADIALGSKYFIFSDNSEERYDHSYNKNYGEIIPSKKYELNNKESDIFYFFDPSPHSKLYLRETVLNIKFPHKCSFTDNLLFFYSLNNANSVVYTDKALAYYLIDRAGNTSTDVKPKVITDHVTAFSAIMNQLTSVKDVMAYRMFESFLSFFYKVDDIKAEESVKIEKYNEAYKFLELLIPYREDIISKIKEYGLDSGVMVRRKTLALNPKTSRKTYDRIVDARLHPSKFKSLRNRLLDIIG